MKDERELIQVLRRSAQAYLRLNNITSVGIGFKQVAGVSTDIPSIQFTVSKKEAPSNLDSLNTKLLPEVIEGIKVDVLERAFHPHVSTVTRYEPRIDVTPANHEVRRSRQNKIQPGMSVGSSRSTAGTVGAIVYCQDSGEPLVLSNWHILEDQRFDSFVCQPGPLDDVNVEYNVLGSVVRSHLGLAGDCAVCSLDTREFDETPLELSVKPQIVGRANIGDRVVKSGRTTGVTYGIVTRVGVVTKLVYGSPFETTAAQYYRAQAVNVGGFEIGPDPDFPSVAGEISKAGDSGALWLIHEEGRATDVAVGLHLGGESNVVPGREHALACNLDSIFDKLNVSFQNPMADAIDEHELFQRLQILEARIDAMFQRVDETTCECGLDKLSSSDTNGSSYTPEIAGIKWPVHGNWCGPGYGHGTPVDALDKACKRHDLCYGKKGALDCACDDRLIAEALAAMPHLSSKAKAKAAAIAAYFKIAPCANHIKGIPIPWPKGIPTGSPLPFPIPKPSIPKIPKPSWPF